MLIAQTGAAFKTAPVFMYIGLSSLITLASLAQIPELHKHSDIPNWPFHPAKHRHELNNSEAYKESLLSLGLFFPVSLIKLYMPIAILSVPVANTLEVIYGVSFL